MRFIFAPPPGAADRSGGHPWRSSWTAQRSLAIQITARAGSICRGSGVGIWRCVRHLASHNNFPWIFFQKIKFATAFREVSPWRRPLLPLGHIPRKGKAHRAKFSVCKHAAAARSASFVTHPAADPSTLRDPHNLGRPQKWAAPKTLQKQWKSTGLGERIIFRSPTGWTKSWVRPTRNTQGWEHRQLADVGILETVLH